MAGLPPPAVAQDGDGAPPGDLPSCNICDKTFKTLSDVTKHRRIHYDGKYQCSHCGKKFKSAWNRNVHERQVHGNVKFNCKFCDKSYKSQVTLKSHVKKKHAAEEETLERQLEEDPDLTLEALEVGEGMEPEEVQEMTVNVVHSDQMNHGGVVIQSSECAVLEKEGEVLVQPDMEAETQSSPDTSEHFDTVYKSCFQRNRDSFSSDNNNNNKCSIKVRIGDEELVIIGKEELVLTAGTIVHDYFYPEEGEDELVEAAPPAPASAEAEEMETDNNGQVSAMGDDYAGYTGAEESAVPAEVTETVKEVQESVLPALATDMGNAGYAEAGEEVEETETVTEVQESVLPAQDEVAGDDADNGAGEAENIVTEASSSTGQSGKAVKRYKCTVCEKSYARKQYLREHQKAHMFEQWKCVSCDKSFTHKCILKHEQQMHASDEDRILCPQCGKQFRSKPNLKQHMVVHEKKEENYSKEMKQEALQLIKKHGKAEGAQIKGVLQCDQTLGTTEQKMLHLFHLWQRTQ